jgi:transcriptional regulator with XRE-family HTH domain
MRQTPAGQKTVTKKKREMPAAAPRKLRSLAADSAEDVSRRQIIGQRIRQHRRSRGWTLTQLQERSNINNGNLSKIENGIQSLSNKTMQALADAFNVSIADLFEKEAAPANTVGARTGLTPASTDLAVHVSKYAKLADIPENSCVAIGTIDVHPDAASGGVIFGRNDRIVHRFHGGTIAQIAAEPASLVSFEIPDDMMAPRLHPKDVVVVDLGDRTIPMNGGVFAIVLDGETIAIRRLMPFVNRGLRIMCDNTHYPEMTLNGAQAASVYIAGRVRSMRGNGGF